MHIFLTGEIQIGKSTLLNKVLSRYPDVHPAGFRTVTVADIPDAIGSVYIIPAEDKTPMHTAACRIGIRRGYPKGLEMFPKVFDLRGVELLEKSEESKLILMDEIGKMEATADRFCSRVRELLDGNTPIFGVLRKEGDTPLQLFIRNHPNVRLILVTEENRDRLVDEIVKMLRVEMNKRTDSAGAIVTRTIHGEKEVLMIRTGEGWSFPKGHIEYGETEQETAAREVKEETGISVEILPGFRFETRSGLQDEQRKVIYYLGKDMGGILDPDFNEISDASWQLAEEVPGLLRFQDDLAPWEAAIKYLASRQI
ncbi:MAG: NUDIX domain-containing protein [Lachnospiraceae bacterium]|nr:NUDIX domain-containing protein [Lachnospiraceae bacterium]